MHRPESVNTIGEGNPAQTALRALHWEVADGGGWEFLLPQGARRRWLCLDATGGATTLLLAPLCDELHVIPTSDDAAVDIAAKLRLAGVDNVQLRPARIDSNAHAGPATLYDGLVVHDLAGTLGQDCIASTLRAGARSLALRGFIYVALPNRYGYTRLRRWASSFPRRSCTRFHSAAEVRRLIGSERPVRLYPLISDERGRLLEMVPSGRFASV